MRNHSHQHHFFIIKITQKHFKLLFICNGVDLADALNSFCHVFKKMLICLYPYHFGLIASNCFMTWNSLIMIS